MWMEASVQNSQIGYGNCFNDWMDHFMKPAEQIAEDTWGRIKQSRDLRVRLGEETLTDLLILDFIRLMKSRTKLFQSTKTQESKRGTDLEIRIHAGGNRAAVFAVQAKKLYRSERYGALYAKAKSQMKILEKYSRSVGAIPLYLLYNYVGRHKIQPYWHCCGCPDERQLGCTLVPSWNIRRAISMRGHRNFDSIHASCAALPWRCLFDCPQGRSHRLLSAARRSLSFLPSDDAQNYTWVRFESVDDGWPEWLWSRDDGTLLYKDVERLRREPGVYETEQALNSVGPTEKLVPRRLLLVKESDPKSRRGDDIQRADH